MKREIIHTRDGSTSLFLPELNETYHSRHGAIQEANHVFIKNGFSLLMVKPISILEIGFGTGLNTLITFNKNLKYNQQITYDGVEAFPITLDEAMQMNYFDQINPNLQDIYLKMHTSEWEKEIQLNENFTLLKRKQLFQEIKDYNKYDLIYFDAFGYDIQPELWSKEIFKNMFEALNKNGILVTYACRLVIKNNMKNAGFKVEVLPGAPGKREMIRAVK